MSTSHQLLLFFRVLFLSACFNHAISYLLHDKVPQVKSIVSVTFKKTGFVSSALDYCRLYGRRCHLSVTQLKDSNNDGLANANNQRPIPTLTSLSLLREMIDRKELFPDTSMTQQEVDSIMTAELSNLSKAYLTQFLFLSVKYSKKRNRKIEIMRRHLVAIELNLRKFGTSSWTGRDVAFIMNSLQVVRSDDSGVNKFLLLMTNVVRDSLNNADIKKRLTPQGIGMTMIGLQHMNSDNTHVRDLLSALLPKIDACKEALKAQEVGMALFGMQGMSSYSFEACAMLKVLVPKVESCPALDAQAIGNALYGMKSMSSDSFETCEILKALVPKVESCTEILDAQAVCNAIYGMMKMSSDCPEVRAMLLALVPKVKSSIETFNAQNVGNALYGMKTMTSDCVEVRTMLSALVPKVKSCTAPLSSQNVGNALYGMQEMSSDSAEVRAMLLALIPKVESCTDTVAAQAVGNSLYGMKTMNSDCVEVRAMLSALIPKVESCTETLNSQAMSNSLYGMKTMNSNSIEVCKMLSILVPKVKSCTEALTSQDVSMALYGMQGMSYESPEVCAMLKALAPKVESCIETFSAQNVGNTLYGMQGMSSDSAEVSSMLSALVSKVKGSKETLSSQHIGMALYGLQGMRSDSAEVCAMLSALVPKIKNCIETFNAQHIGMALYGLQGMRGEGDLLFFIDFLYNQIMTIAGSPLLLQSLTSKDLTFLNQHLVLTLPELQEEMKDGYGRWEALTLVLSDELVKRKNDNDPFFNVGQFRSVVEQRVYTIGKKVFENSAESISSNEYLCSIFEGDIVLRVPIATDKDPSGFKPLIINIEVDGISHKQETKKRFCILRDKYLKSQGVVIERIEASTLKKMTDLEVGEWILERVTIGRNFAEVQTVEKKVMVTTGLEVNYIVIDNSPSLQAMIDNDIQVKKSVDNQVLNPISKRMIRIGGDTYNKLIRLGYFLSNDGKLTFNNT